MSAARQPDAPLTAARRAVVERVGARMIPRYSPPRTAPSGKVLHLHVERGAPSD